MALDYITNSRGYTVTVDQYGVDPLLNKTSTLISQINNFVLYSVSQHERGRPDLIAYKQYGDPNYWWVILNFNALVSFKEIKEGITIRIPNYAAVTKILSNAASQTYGQTVRTVTI